MPELPYSQVRSRLFAFSEEVAEALASGRSLVALESAVIGRGLPGSIAAEVAVEVEAAVRRAGAVPATICLADGRIRIGLTPTLLERLTTPGAARKTSTRDLAPHLAAGDLGATTVAATLWLAREAGIPIFATGGIGGVHPGPVPDISADLVELGRTLGAVVCAGPKTIVDPVATAEYLESLGVPVVGVGTDRLPWFYVRESPAPIAHRVEQIEEAAQIVQFQKQLDLPGAVLVVQPLAAEVALAAAEVAGWQAEAEAEAAAQKVGGADLTPFLLARLAELSNGRTLAANRTLLVANAVGAARLAVALASAGPIV